MQRITNQVLDAFDDAKNVTKSHIPVVNVPARIEILEDGFVVKAIKEPQGRQKHGRPVGAKNTVPEKRREKLKVPVFNVFIY